MFDKFPNTILEECDHFLVKRVNVSRHHKIFKKYTQILFEFKFKTTTFIVEISIHRDLCVGMTI